MSTRHIARTLALQTLFEIDMRDLFSLTNEKDIVAIVERNKEEFGEGIKDSSFTQNVVNTVLSRKITIDDIIVRAAPDWPLDKISTVDRNILRLGLAELLFGDRTQVPPKVAIDEAIELAKSFGGETSGKFVNGVLGGVYKEMGEPEKNQTTKSKDPIKNEREMLVGAIIISRSDNKNYVAFVHDVFGYWTLPKTHIKNQTLIEASAQEGIKRETGLNIELVEKIAENEYIANKPEIGKVIKHVIYYHAKSAYRDLVLEKKGGLDDIRWFLFEEVKTIRMYDDIKAILLPFLEKINDHN
jgi:transcription antitermination protein NusB